MFAPKIRLARLGHKNDPVHAIVVMHQRQRRDGQPLERLGMYDEKLRKDGLQTMELNFERTELLAGKRCTDV